MSQPKSNKSTNSTVRYENISLNLLKANDLVAKMIRERLPNILILNICSAPGSGKTTLLQETGKLLKGKLNIAVLVGDPETERDAIRMQKAGIYAVQIVTGGICHIEAQTVLQALEHMNLENVDILFIENVGNLVCPAGFDLGEDYRITVLSCTEGDDKPKKYPNMFLSSELMLISKSDLLPHLPFSVEAAIQDAQEVNPTIEVITLSGINGQGMDRWCQWLFDKVKEKNEKITTK